MYLMVLFDKYESRIRRNYGGKLFLLKASRMTLHGMLLNALEMSKDTIKARPSFFTAEEVILLTSSRASQVDLFFLNPNWLLERSDPELSICHRKILSARTISKVFPSSSMRQIGLAFGVSDASGAFPVIGKFPIFEADIKDVRHSGCNTCGCAFPKNHLESPGALDKDEEPLLSARVTSNKETRKSSDQTKSDQSSIGSDK